MAALRQRLSTLQTHPIEKTVAFQEYLQRSKVRSRRTLEGALQRILRVTQQCSLDELTGVHIEHGIAYLVGEGYSSAYIDRVIRALNAFLNWAMRNAFVVGNAADGVVAPKDTTYREPVVVSEPMLIKVQEYALGTGVVEDILLWAFLRAGCRISEPCAIRKSNLLIDPSNKTAFAIVGWKTHERKISLPTWSYKYVAKWLEVNSPAPDDKLVLYLKGTPLDLSAPPNTQTTQMDNRTLICRNRIDAWQKVALQEIVFDPKDMRSSFITKALRANPNQLAELAKFVGNSPQVLLKDYAHLFNQTDFSDAMG